MSASSAAIERPDIRPKFMKNPIMTLRYYSRTRPQYFWPSAIAFAIPVVGFVGYPLRLKFYGNHEPVPRRYPLPKRDRVPLEGYDD
ncbi:hypothetical protein V1511DRAFT_513126 [Dipodascopsis uninucleata]